MCLYVPPEGPFVFVYLGKEESLALDIKDKSKRKERKDHFKITRSYANLRARRDVPYE